MARAYDQPHHPTAYFSPTKGYFIAHDSAEQLLRVTGRQPTNVADLPVDAYSLIPCDDEPELPHTERADRWVAVQFSDRGPVLILHEDGTVTERHTMPAGDIAHTARGAA